MVWNLTHFFFFATFFKGLPLSGHSRLLFLRLVRLVSTASRVTTAQKKTHRHQRRQHPASITRTTSPGDDDAGVSDASRPAYGV